MPLFGNKSTRVFFTTDLHGSTVVFKKFINAGKFYEAQVLILGGDMNHAGVGRLAADAGYAWPTESGPPTATIGRLDHIFIKGLSIPQANAAGTVLETRGASDHRPVWARAVLR